MSFWQVAGSAGFLDLETTFGYKVTQQPGQGMAPVSNISSTYGLLDGALYQRTRTEAKQFTLIGTLRGSTVADLHAKRRNLISAIAPDRAGSPGQPVIFRYTGGASTLSGSAFYRGGLELGNVRARTEANISFTFEQFDPYWEKITSSSAALTTQTTFGASGVAQRAACGSWGTMGNGLNGTVNSIVASSNGPILVFGGTFTTASGAEACRIAQWSGTAWSKVGNAVNNTVNSLVYDQSRNFLIAGGAFTTASGATVNRIALWTGTAWTSMSSGMDSTVSTLLAHSSGSIIAGGAFTAAGGTTASFIARWNHAASTWTAMSTGMHAPNPAANGTVNSLAEMLNGDIVAVGAFNNAGGTSSSGAAVWAGSSWAAMGPSGLNGDGNSATVTSDGTLFSGAGTGSASHLNSWNGATWKGYQNITNNSVLDSIVDQFTENLYITGEFTQINGSIPSVGLARLIGQTTTIISDISFGSATNITAIHSASTGVLTIGLSSTPVTASAAAVTAITNSGTAATYPILTACAPAAASARFSQLINYTTRDSIYFDLAMLPSEMITLDLRPGKKTLTSSIRGNIISTILPGSNTSTWRLLPGTNNISVWLSSGSGSVKLEWTERFWSIDN